MLLKVANNKQTKNEAYRKSDEKRSDEDDEENFEDDIGSSDIPFHPVNCAAFNTFCEKLFIRQCVLLTVTVLTLKPRNSA